MAELSIPTEREIASLPYRARVAFAGRCSRRVQHVYNSQWSDAPATHGRAVDNAITMAESIAAGFVDNSLSKCWRAEDDVKAATHTDKAGSNAAANAAADAARSATHSYLSAKAAANAATDSARCAEGFRPQIVAAMRRDYELLKAAAQRERWTDDTPVPPEFFGPLWPDGAPEGWLFDSTSEEPVDLVIELEVPDNATGEEIASRLKELAREMDGMHRTLGGGGLKIKGVEVRVDANAPAEVRP